MRSITAFSSTGVLLVGIASAAVVPTRPNNVVSSLTLAPRATAAGDNAHLMPDMYTCLRNQAMLCERMGKDDWENTSFYQPTHLGERTKACMADAAVVCGESDSHDIVERMFSDMPAAPMPTDPTQPPPRDDIKMIPFKFLGFGWSTITVDGKAVRDRHTTKELYTCVTYNNQLCKSWYYLNPTDWVDQGGYPKPNSDRMRQCLHAAGVACRLRVNHQHASIMSAQPASVFDHSGPALEARTAVSGLVPEATATISRRTDAEIDEPKVVAGCWKREEGLCKAKHPNGGTLPGEFPMPNKEFMECLKAVARTCRTSPFHLYAAIMSAQPTKTTDAATFSALVARTTMAVSGIPHPPLMPTEEQITCLKHKAELCKKKYPDQWSLLNDRSFTNPKTDSIMGCFYGNFVACKVPIPVNILAQHTKTPSSTLVPRTAMAVSDIPNPPLRATEERTACWKLKAELCKKKYPDQWPLLSDWHHPNPKTDSIVGCLYKNFIACEIPIPVNGPAQLTDVMPTSPQGKLIPRNKVDVDGPAYPGAYSIKMQQVCYAHQKQLCLASHQKGWTTEDGPTKFSARVMDCLHGADLACRKSFSDVSPATGQQQTPNAIRAAPQPLSTVPTARAGCVVRNIVANCPYVDKKMLDKCANRFMDVCNDPAAHRLKNREESSPSQTTMQTTVQPSVQPSTKFMEHVTEQDRACTINESYLCKKRNNLMSESDSGKEAKCILEAFTKCNIKVTPVIRQVITESLENIEMTDIDVPIQTFNVNWCAMFWNPHECTGKPGPQIDYASAE